jgi:hypothetical protein
VFVNLASLAPHAEFFPDHPPAPFSTHDELQPKLEAWGKSFAGRLLDKAPFVERFTTDSETGVARAKVGGFIAWFPTLADVGGAAINVSWISVAPRFDDAGDRAFELGFHNAWMNVHHHRLGA